MSDTHIINSINCILRRFDEYHGRGRYNNHFIGKYRISSVRSIFNTLLNYELMQEAIYRDLLDDDFKRAIAKVGFGELLNNVSLFRIHKKVVSQLCNK